MFVVHYFLKKVWSLINMFPVRGIFIYHRVHPGKVLNRAKNEVASPKPGCKRLSAICNVVAYAAYVVQGI